MKLRISVKILSFLFILVILGSSVLLLCKMQGRKVSIQPQALAVTHVQTTQENRGINNGTSLKAKDRVMAAIDNEWNIPSPKTLKEEAKENPHITPPSVTRFAIRMAKKLKASLENSEKASKLFSELRECAQSNSQDIPTTIRAMCLSYAEYLSQFHSNLGSHFEKLLEETSHEVKYLTSSQPKLGEVND